MNSTIYFLADYFPWWAFPLAFILAEVGNSFRRQGRSVRMLFFLFWSLLLLVLSILYIVDNGKERLSPAMQNLENQYLRRK